MVRILFLVTRFLHCQTNHIHSAAKHKKANKQVAIKKIYNWDENTTEAARTIREIKLLRHFSGSPYV